MSDETPLPDAQDIARSVARRYARFADADDLTQDILLAFLRSFACDERHITASPALLRTTARRRAIDVVRRDAVRLKCEPLQDTAFTTHDSDALLDARAVLERLPPRDRLVVAARAYGYSDIEIARVTNVTPGRVSQIANAAAHALRGEAALCA